MRLWHYKLLPYLPKSQIQGQWRELNSIFKNQPKHILINYVYEYPKKDLLVYTELLLIEMTKRGIKANMKNVYAYFGTYNPVYDFNYKPFKDHHTPRYLKQCFYNLQEKYDRGQSDFTKEQYIKLNEAYWFNYN